MQLNHSLKKKEAQIRSKLLIGVSCGLTMTNFPRVLNTKTSNLFKAFCTEDYADKKKTFFVPTILASFIFISSFSEQASRSSVRERSPQLLEGLDSPPFCFVLFFLSLGLKWNGLRHPRRMRALIRSTFKSLAHLFQISSESSASCFHLFESRSSTES